jgi:transposase InsO family protein
VIIAAVENVGRPRLDLHLAADHDIIDGRRRDLDAARAIDVGIVDHVHLCLGIEASPSFVREPEGNGVAERFIRTLKENLLWVRTFDTTGRPAQQERAMHDKFSRRIEASAWPPASPARRSVSTRRR